MATVKYKPTTPSRRNMQAPSFEEVTKFTPEKSLITKKKKTAGRNSYGRITVRHHGGGNKQKYRIMDFKRQNDESAKVIGIALAWLIALELFAKLLFNHAIKKVTVQGG